MLLFTDGADIMANKAFCRTTLGKFFSIFLPAFVRLGQHFLGHNALPEIHLLTRFDPLGVLLTFYILPKVKHSQTDRGSGS